MSDADSLALLAELDAARAEVERLKALSLTAMVDEARARTDLRARGDALATAVERLVLKGGPGGFQAAERCREALAAWRKP